MFEVPKVNYKPLELLSSQLQQSEQGREQNALQVEQLRQENDKRLAGQRIVSDAGKALSDYDSEVSQLGPLEALSLFPEKQAALDRATQKMNQRMSSLGAQASQFDPNIANYIEKAKETSARKVPAITDASLAALVGVPGETGARAKQAIDARIGMEAGKQQAIADRQVKVAEATQKPFKDSTPFDAYNPKTKKVEKAVWRTDQKTGEGKLTFTGAETPGTTSIGLDPNLQGKKAVEELGKLDPAVAKNVEAIAHYKSKESTLYPNRNYRGVGGYTIQQIHPLVMQVNPNFDEKKFPMMQKAQQYWTTGQGKTRVGQLNTVAGHITDLDKAVDALDSGDIKLLNSIAQGIGVQTGNSAPVVFDAIRQAVAGELSGLFKAGAGGASPTDPEMQEAAATLNRTLSPDAVRDVIRADVGLIKSRMETEAQAYFTGTESDDFFDRFLTPKARDFYATYFGQQPSFDMMKGATQPAQDNSQQGTQTKNWWE